MTMRFEYELNCLSGEATYSSVSHRRCKSGLDERGPALKGNPKQRQFEHTAQQLLLLLSATWLNGCTRTLIAEPQALDWTGARLRSSAAHVPILPRVQNSCTSVLTFSYECTVERDVANAILNYST